MKTQPLIIKLLILGIIIIFLIIITTILRKPSNTNMKIDEKGDTVALRFEPAKASYPAGKVQFITIVVFMPQGKQISGVDLVLKAKGVAIEPAGSIEPLEPNTGVFNEVLKERTQIVIISHMFLYRRKVCFQELLKYILLLSEVSPAMSLSVSIRQRVQ